MSIEIDSNQGKNAVGRQGQNVTQAQTGVPGDDITQDVPKKRRKYTPRARKCASCGKSFVPKIAHRGVYCSVACRNRAFRKRQRRGRKAGQRETVLHAHICPVCGLGFLGTAQQAYCSNRCRRAAAKLRRAAAAEALAGITGMSVSKALDVIDTAGMKDVAGILSSLGMVWDATAWRCCAVRKERYL